MFLMSVDISPLNTLINSALSISSYLKTSKSNQRSDSHPRHCSERSSAQVRHPSCAVAAAHQRAAVRAAAAGAQRTRREQTRDREARPAPHVLALVLLDLFVLMLVLELVLVMRQPVRIHHWLHVDIFSGRCVTGCVDVAVARRQTACHFTRLSNCSLDVDERGAGQPQIRRHQNGGIRHVARLPPVVEKNLNGSLKRHAQKHKSIFMILWFHDK